MSTEAKQNRRKYGRRWGGLAAKYSSEYNAWLKMIVRCYKSSHKDYHYYGARGISVCDEWRESFIAFLNYIGPKPNPSLTLDRKDNDGNYEPGNVQWATRLHQNRNKRQFKHGRSITERTY